MSNLTRVVTPSTMLGMSFTFLLNSIKFFEEARKQVVVSQQFSRNITWFVILFTIGLLLMGYFIGTISSRKRK